MSQRTPRSPMMERPSRGATPGDRSRAVLSHRLVLPACLALALAGAPGSARADDDEAAKRALVTNSFEAGAAAYSAGKYLAAAEAFEKAYALLPSPPLLFSAAQAYRRQYLVEPSSGTLRRALALYRQYLASDPKANRREDAMEALAVLVPLEVRMPPAEGGTDAAPPDGAPAAPSTRPPADPKRTARILITASAEGAEVSLDGGPFEAAPLVTSVEPRTHTARVRAPGHDEEQVSVPAVPNEQVSQHVRLHPKPGRLEIKGTEGARVFVDGKVAGTVSPGALLPVEAGLHVVSITANGHEPWTGRVEIERDRTLPLEANLALTTQRKVAWATLSAGAAGLIAGGVLGGLALDRQDDAFALRDRQQTGALSVDERDSFNAAVRDRNDLARASAIAFAASGVVLLTGAGLFVLDAPADVPPPERKPGAPGGPGTRATFEVGLGSATLRVQF